MAKGLRSKSKRANRSLLRSQLTIPLVNKSQDELCKRLEQDVAKSNGAAMKRLREKLASKRKDKVDTRTHQKYSMDSESLLGAGADTEEVAVRKAAAEPVKQQLVTVRKASFSFREALAADKAAKK